MSSSRCILRALSIFTISFSAFSALAGEGFYVGAGGGWGEFSTDFKSTGISPNLDPPGKATFDTEGLDSNSGVGEIHVGFRKLFLGNSLVYSFAIEGFAEFQERDLSAHALIDASPQNIDYALDATSNYTFGVTIEPGIFVTNSVMLYLDVGLAYMQLRDIHSYIEDENLDLPAGSFDNENMFGLRAGAGVEWLLTKQLSLDFSWAIDSYEGFSLTRDLSDDPYDPGFNYEKVTFDSPQNNRFLLAFDYYFGLGNF